MMMRFMLVLALAALACYAIPDAASAQDGEQVKAGHREAAQRYYDAFASGVKLTGTVEQNGSRGQFVAYSFNKRFLVRETFGALDSFGVSANNEYWVGSSYELPFKIEQEDNPSTWVLNLLADGSYLEEPYWSCFNYVDEDAGGFNFEFKVEGLPAVKVVLYSDTEDPQYLQMMSLEIPLSPNDSGSNTRRSYYQYTVEPGGAVYTNHETSREIDPSGSTVNFAEYLVESVDRLEGEPAELSVDLGRGPVGDKSQTVSAPVEVPVETNKGFFIVPVTFAGSDETVNFILDTGASSSIMTPAAAELAQVKSDLSIPAYGHGSKADFGLGLCTTASLGRADAPAEQRIPLSGIPAAIISPNNTDLIGAMGFYGVGGILGISILHQYVAKFDADAKIITFYPPQIFNVDQHVGRPNIEYWLDVEDLVYFKGKLNGTLEGEVVLDSGLQQDLALLRETLDNAGIELNKIDERDGMVVGGSRSFDYVEVPSFELGPMGWQDIVASMTDDSQGLQSARGLLGFVGVSLFFANRITLDLFNQRMYVEPYDGVEQFGKPQQEPPTDQEGTAPPGDDAGKTKLPVDIG